MEGRHQSTSVPGFRLDGGLPSVGVRRKIVGPPPTIFRWGGVARTTATFLGNQASY